MIDDKDLGPSQPMDLELHPSTLTSAPQPINPNPDLLTCKQLANTLQVSRNQAIYLIRKHRLPVHAKNYRGFSLYKLEDLCT